METLKIEEIVEIKSGIAAYKQIDNGEKVIYYQMSNYNADTNKFENGTIATVTSNQLQKHLLCKNKLLFTAKGATYYCALYNPEQEEKAIACSSFFILEVTDERITPEYLCWYLNRPEIGKKMMRWSSNFFTIKKEQLTSLSIPLVSLEVQYHIYNIIKLQTRAVKIEKEKLELCQEFCFGIIQR